MRSKILVVLLAAVAAWRLGVPGSPVVAAEKAAATTSPSWSVNATAIEAGHQGRTLEDIPRDVAVGVRPAVAVELPVRAHLRDQVEV